VKAGTLFSGIGAPELAAPDLDWRWCAEIDPFACAVLARRFPQQPNLGDVTEIDPHAVEPVDILVFGSPCQSFSVAGERGGMADARGELVWTALDIIAGLQPAWIVFENVPGLLSSGGGRDFGAILGTLGDLGYGFAYRVLDAQFFGVPQRRRRLFVVACLGDWRAAAAVLFERQSLRRDPAPRRQAPQTIAGSAAAIPLRASGSGTAHGAGIGAIGDPALTLDRDGSMAIAFTIVPPLVARSTRGSAQTLSPGYHTDGHIVAGQAPRRLTPRECERLQGLPDDWTLIRHRRKPAADGPRYRAIGNSMAVPVMRWILDRLRAVAYQRLAA
jgi:DNA (cytosine-5)-methyltransferase 1